MVRLVVVLMCVGGGPVIWTTHVLAAEGSDGEGNSLDTTKMFESLFAFSVDGTTADANLEGEGKPIPQSVLEKKLSDITPFYLFTDDVGQAIKGLRDKNPDKRLAALETLIVWSETAPIIFSEFEPLLKDSDLRIRAKLAGHYLYKRRFVAESETFIVQLVRTSKNESLLQDIFSQLHTIGPLAKFLLPEVLLHVVNSPVLRGSCCELIQRMDVRAPQMSLSNYFRKEMARNYETLEDISIHSFMKMHKEIVELFYLSHVIASLQTYPWSQIKQARYVEDRVKLISNLVESVDHIRDNMPTLLRFLVFSHTRQKSVTILKTLMNLISRIERMIHSVLRNDKSVHVRMEALNLYSRVYRGSTQMPPVFRDTRKTLEFALNSDSLRLVRKAVGLVAFLNRRDLSPQLRHRIKKIPTRNQGLRQDILSVLNDFNRSCEDP